MVDGQCGAGVVGDAVEGMIGSANLGGGFDRCLVSLRKVAHTLYS